MQDFASQGNGIRRGVGALLAAAALVPAAVGAAGPASSTAHATDPAAIPAGSFVNATVSLGRIFSLMGDMISAGWDISIPENHPAATVGVSGVTATLPFLCLTGTSHALRSFVIHLPNASISFPANDTAWLPTSSPSSVAGYQGSAALPALCENGLMIPRGTIVYAAKVVSADTTNVFAMRFHAVDGRSFIPHRAPGRHDRDDHAARDGRGRGPAHQQQTTNTDCSSTIQNTGLAPCIAVWTSATDNTAAAPPPTARGPGGGPPTGRGPGGGTPAASSSGPVSGTRRAATPVRLPVIVAPRAAAPVAVPSVAVKGPASAPMPVLVLPVPSSPTVLGPVPLMLPVIASGGSPVAAALPWNWFVLLALVDLGLIVGIVLRRRGSRGDKPGAQ